MAKKLKTTAFTRFLIMIIFVAPLAYIGAAYYNGQDPIANIKRIFQGESESRDNSSATKNLDESIELLKEQLEACQEKNAELNVKIGELKSQIPN